MTYTWKSKPIELVGMSKAPNALLSLNYVCVCMCMCVCVCVCVCYEEEEGVHANTRQSG